MHCGAAHYSYQDARRTAGNTNDYNGKMLRFRPKPDLPDGAQPPVGPGSTYDIPGPDAPNGPNLFDGDGGRRRQDQARDLRDGPAQSVAALDRPEDRHPVRGLGRAGRRRPQRDAGPVDVRERLADRSRRQLRLALLHGQRAGLSRPDRRPDRAGRPDQDAAADDQRARLRVRRPGDRRHRRLVRLRQPPQRLPEQHRARRVPARDRDRDGRGHAAPHEHLVQPRQPRQRERLPRLPT